MAYKRLREIYNELLQMEFTLSIESGELSRTKLSTAIGSALNSIVRARAEMEEMTMVHYDGLLDYEKNVVLRKIEN